MAKGKALKSSDQPRRLRPAMTPEGRESQLVSLAIDLAEKQLLAGTASSQVITHYLKLGSQQHKTEQEILEKQKKLMDAKTEALQSAKRMEDLYVDAMAAFRKYSGHGADDGD